MEPSLGRRNFNPFLAWSLGASCVALNWQRWDKAMWVNEGKFLDNGGCGYVLKPDWMRDARDELPQRTEPRRLRVHVFSASKPVPLRQRLFGCKDIEASFSLLVCMFMNQLPVN